MTNHNITEHDYQKVQDIKKLYSITEAEGHLLIGIVDMIKKFGFSHNLAIKLFSAAIALIETFPPENEK